MRSRIFIIMVILVGLAELSLHGRKSEGIQVNSGDVRDVTELPELMVKSGRDKILHILAYVREFSELTTYTDTVALFREKMVDFMLVGGKKSKFRGWVNPRVLASDSYYRFSDSDGLDSVSDSYRLHFSWSDRMKLPSIIELPLQLSDKTDVRDTIAGRYGAAEVWSRKSEKISVNIDVLADTSARRWAADFSRFFHEGLDFDRFKINYSYDNITDSLLRPEDLTSFTYHIDSYGRGADLFRFKGKEEPYFVTTDADIYILDREYISEREAKKWLALETDSDALEILVPEAAPQLSPSILSLIDRVNSRDSVSIRINYIPDKRLSTQYNTKRALTHGERALQMLKSVTGISKAKRDREWHKMNNKWKKFQKSK